jgi:cathepsin L
MISASSASAAIAITTLWLCAVATTAITVSTSKLGKVDWSFQQYLDYHGKSYNSKEEHLRRQTLFDRTKKSVLLQNKRYELKESTWWATLNYLSDLTEVELSAMGAQQLPISADMFSLSSKRHHEEKVTQSTYKSNNSTNPPSVTWVDVQSPIRNQGGCGSCWAFGTVEVLESHLAIAENNTTPVVLAPQTLVDCAHNPKHCGGTGGCEGATPDIGFNFTRNAGIALESNYPYTGKDGSCSKHTNTVTCSGFTKVISNSAQAMETALAQVGPVAVTVSANWQTYGGGIFKDGCLSWLGSCTLDHVVVVVGYTAESWLIRNSWGATWGEQGYIRLSRKNDNVTYADDHPSQGTACEPFPKTQNVMGEGGVLFAGVYPNDVARS